MPALTTQPCRWRSWSRSWATWRYALGPQSPAGVKSNALLQISLFKPKRSHARTVVLLSVGIKIKKSKTERCLSSLTRHVAAGKWIEHDVAAQLKTQ